MPRILLSPTSPYSAKVRIGATAAGFAFDTVLVDTMAQPEVLVSANPLGKIPVLVLDDGESIFDSRAITQYINRVSNSALYPRNAAKRTAVEKLEALCDGICDCALAHVYERRFRPAEIVHQPWLDRLWVKVERGLDSLVKQTPRLGRKPDAGTIALRVLIAYLDMRFAGKWERGRAKLRRWAARFDERFPELTQFLPRQP